MRTNNALDKFPDRLLEKIYEAAVIPDQWRGVVDQLAEISAMKGGAIGVFVAGPQQNIRFIASDCLRSYMEAFSRPEWLARNSRAAKLAPMQYRGFVTDLDLFTRKEMNRDPFYTELLRPHGLGWGAGTLIPTPTGDTIVIAVEGSSGPVKRGAIKTLDALRPHLARAGLLAARLRLERAQTTVDVLRLVGIPAAILQDSGVVLAANELLEQLGTIVFRARDRIALSNGSANQLFMEALSQLNSDASDRAVFSIPVHAADEQPPFVVHLIPVKGAARDILWGGLAILLVTKVTAPRPVPGDLLCGLFDLSPAEARVASFIVEGRAIKSIAEELGVSHETVRTQTKSVFIKTGVNRQAELVGLLANTSSYRIDT